jgi:hypothetical protein
LILGSQYLKYPAVDGCGKWRGGYKPIALRCLPPQPGGPGGDSLGGIPIASDSRRPGDQDGIALVAGAAAANPLAREIHRLRRLLRESRTRFADALDRLLIADLLVPLSSAANGAAAKDGLPLHIVDGARFLYADQRALGAMARHDFAALDIAVACLSSQRLLQEQYRPKLPSPSGTRADTAKAAFPPRDSFGLSEFGLALDDGDLISPADIDAMQG